MRHIGAAPRAYGGSAAARGASGIAGGSKEGGAPWEALSGAVPARSALRRKAVRGTPGNSKARASGSRPSLSPGRAYLYSSPFGPTIFPDHTFLAALYTAAVSPSKYGEVM
ncbi:hypothetical protein GCM10020220_107810 [Nonomuraea rubra]